MSVMERARKAMPQGDGRPWLDGIKDTLIHDAIPFAVVDVNYDSVGSGKFKNPRWIVAIVGWFEGDLIDGKPLEGKLSFTGNSTRDPMFEDLQDQLDEKEKEVGPGNAELGPLCLIKGSSKNGNRYYTLADYDEAKGAPILPDQAQPEASNGQSARRRPVHGGDNVPPVEHTRQSTGQRQRRGARAQAAEPEAAAPEGSSEATPAAEAASPAAEPEASGRTRRTRSEAASASSEEGGAKMGFAHCPDCNQDLHAKAYPKDDGSGDYVIVHAKCEKNPGKMIMLPATFA